MSESPDMASTAWLDRQSWRDDDAGDSVSVLDLAELGADVEGVLPELF